MKILANIFLPLIQLPLPLHLPSSTVFISGLDLVLLHIPGETPCQMAVWIPSRGVLLPGDDFYRAFPNLYAIRGTSPRSVLTWANSLDVMRKLGAEYLVPSHTRPVTGKDEVGEMNEVSLVGVDCWVRWMDGWCRGRRESGERKDGIIVLSFRRGRYFLTRIKRTSMRTNLGVKSLCQNTERIHVGDTDRT